MAFFSDRSQTWIWFSVIAAVVAAVVIIQFLRANQETPNPSIEKAPVYTTGTIVEGLMELPAEQHKTFRLNFNKRTKIFGTHKTGDGRKRVSAMILREGEVEKWEAGAEFTAVSMTGFVPNGKIETVVDPGVYFLIFDNRSKEYGGPQKFQVDFRVE